MQVKNPFEVLGEAERYQKYRPMYHHLPFNLIREVNGEDFESALDVACGTGHSTFALAEFSKNIVGCDLSRAMLDEARRNYKFEFIHASAEDLPFADGSFDLVNISMGFHWVDQGKFLQQVRRVLKASGLLSVDNYGFLGPISNDTTKQELHKKLFENYLPPAGRHAGYPKDELARAMGFELVKGIEYGHHVSMSDIEFTNLLMTWSNFQVLTEEKKLLALKAMREVYASIFEGRRLDLYFGGKVVLYRLG